MPMNSHQIHSEELVDEALMDTFPASDPPSWTLGRAPDPGAAPVDMTYRLFGRTGVRVSAIGLGGWHLGLKKVSAALATRIVHAAIDRGITFFDNSWDYNDGASETRMGSALRDGRRGKVFLMTKIDGRSKAEAARQLEQSLRRLQTDCLDLVQH